MTLWLLPNRVEITAPKLLLSRKVATLALIQQAYAARIFDACLLQAHLSFCAQLTSEPGDFQN